MTTAAHACECSSFTSTCPRSASEIHMSKKTSCLLLELQDVYATTLSMLTCLTSRYFTCAYSLSHLHLHVTIALISSFCPDRYHRRRSFDCNDCQVLAKTMLMACCTRPLARTLPGIRPHRGLTYLLHKCRWPVHVWRKLRSTCMSETVFPRCNPI